MSPEKLTVTTIDRSTIDAKKSQTKKAIAEADNWTKVAVAGETTAEITPAIGSAAEVTTTGAGSTLGIISGVVSGIGVLLVGGLWFAGRRELQQIKTKIHSLNEETAELEIIAQTIEGENSDRKAAQAAVIELLKKRDKQSVATADNLSAAAAGGSAMVTTESLAAQPLGFMTFLGLLIFPIALIFATMAAGLILFRNYQYRKLEKIEEQLEKERQASLDELKKMGIYSPIAINPADIKANNDKILRVSKKDRFCAFGVSAVFGILTIATLYAVGVTLALTTPLGWMALAAIGLVSLAVTTWAFYKKIIMPKIKSQAAACRDRIQKMCGSNNEGKKKSFFSSAVVISFIGIFLGILALITSPISALPLAFGAAFVLGGTVIYCTRKISANETARENVVTQVAKEVRQKEIEHLEKDLKSEKIESVVLDHQQNGHEEPTADQDARVAENITGMHDFPPLEQPSVVPSPRYTEGEDKEGSEGERRGDGAAHPRE